MATATAPVHHAHAPAHTPRSKWTGPGWYRVLIAMPLGLALAFAIDIPIRWAFHYHPLVDGNAIATIAMITIPMSFLIGIGWLRLLVLLGLGRRDARGGPLGSRRDEVAGLLPRQHRPQGHRDPVHLHHVLLLRRRRPDGDADARGAGSAGLAVRRREHVQRPVLGARVADDLPVHHPGVCRHRELRRAADDRRAGHGVPAPERAVVLAAADGRSPDARVVPGTGGRLRDRLDVLRAAVDRHAARPDVLQPGGPVRRRLVGRNRSELPGHDHHDARAGHDLLAHAAAGLGELHDLTAGRHRH